jgi:hypothetical protein
MKKLKLNLDTLHVDSFETGLSIKGRGTVQGHDTTIASLGCIPSNDNSIGCPGTYTCGENSDGPGCQSNPWTVIVW